MSNSRFDTTLTLNQGDAEKSFIFTPSQDWFTHNISTWEPLIQSLLSTLSPDRVPRALEVGSWEGRSAVYLLTKLCTSPSSLLVCIDHFDLSRTNAGKERHAKVLHNLRCTGSPFRLIDEFSVPGLMTLLQEEANRTSSSGGFDFVYLDGSHEADDTLLDAELAWRLARPGALFVFDDYAWNKEPPTSIHHPSRGIDAFLALHTGQYELLVKGYQVILRKTSEMRLGFLTKASPATSGGADLRGLDYGINIVICANAEYAMPAAVAIRSAIESTPGRRLSFYVIDCGLQEDDRTRIYASIPDSANESVALVFRALPEGSRGLKEPTWAKVDMLTRSAVLPVERVLFLDADVLVRHDLEKLWGADLGGKMFGAVRDIGNPSGHGGLPPSEYGRPYFNAGMMLLDLARIRTQIPELVQMAHARPETTYKDQDLLNAFFPSDTWFELGIEWNAGGLGTYAAWPSKDRDAVWMKGELEALHVDPSIVHFTGPVHPSMSGVLNDYVQPWTSKPWGYAGAPGNPFSGEWWEVLGRTSWGDIRQDEGFLKNCKGAREKALKQGMRDFEHRVHDSFLV